MTNEQARTLMLRAAIRAELAKSYERLGYVAETVAIYDQVQRDARSLRRMLAAVGATTSTELSLLSAGSRAGEALDFESLTEVARAVVQRDQLDKLRYTLRCRLAYLASLYGTPTRETSKLPRAKRARRSR